MSIYETYWHPTTASVEKKNRKWELASAIMDIRKEVENITDEKVKQRIIEILLRVL
jgi:hypothetical protein